MSYVKTNWVNNTTDVDATYMNNIEEGIETLDIEKEPTIVEKKTAFNQNFETLESNIKMNGATSVGTSDNVAKADHVHPSDTTKANVSDLVTINENVTTNVNSINTINEQLADFENYETKLSDYGGHLAEEPGYSNFNNHTAIMNALIALNARGGGTLKLPMGTINTSPISFQGFSCIKIKGCGRYLPWGKITTIKFISSGDVGLQFADTTFPNPTWNATHCAIEGIYIEGNNQVNVCMNGNYDLSLSEVCCRHALQDGIRLEDYTYPVHINKCECSYNARHGLYVKGHMTTKYDVMDSEFSNNGGYGLLLEGGASVTFLNCLTQGNSTGGVKLNYITGSYLENILFINHYWEANGTIGSGNVGYDGDYCLVIDSANHTNSTIDKANGIKFIGGAMNASTNGKTYNIVSVYRLSFDGITVDHAKGSIPYPVACGSMLTNSGATSSDTTASSPYPFISAYGVNDGSSVSFLKYRVGIIGTRGRVHTLYFYVNPGSLIANGTVLATPCLDRGNLVDKPLGFPTYGQGSLLGIHIRRPSSAGGAGSVTAKPVYQWDDGYVQNPSIAVNAAAIVTLTLPADTRKLVEFEPLKYPIYQGTVLGIQLITSSDYVVSTKDGFIIEMLVEY